MLSTDHLIKDKRSLLYEILFCLEGIDGDIIDGQKTKDGMVLRLSDSPLNQLLSLSEMHSINQLIPIANNYLFISNCVEKLKLDVNPYKCSLAQTIDKVLMDYRNDLIKTEMDFNKDINYSVIKFNKFLKYSQTFEFLKQVLTKANDEKVSISSALDLLNEYTISGWSRIRRSAQIVFKCNQTLFDDIWSWIMFGFIRYNSSQEFFIIDYQKDVKLELTRVPDFIDKSDASKIHQIGNIVRSAQSRGDQFIYKGSETELYYLYSKVKLELPFSKSVFSQFIEKVRTIVSEYSWNYLVNDQNLKDHLLMIKNFYLTANDNLWTSFVSHVSNIVLNGPQRLQKDVQNSFEVSLRQVFTENTSNQMLTAFSISAIREGNIPVIFLKYEVPVSLKCIFSEDIIDKYNSALNFMINLYSARLNINQIWFRNIKTKLTNDANVSQIEINFSKLSNALTYIIDKLYFYIKVDVIERLYINLMEKIDNFKDVEAIQKEHQIFITNVITQLFLKTSVIKNCLDEIFNVCYKLKNYFGSEVGLKQLIKVLKPEI